jgi:peptide/nickel transport system ATP-binding protein
MTDQNLSLPDDILCRVRNLRIQFKTDEGVMTALEGVNYDIPKSGTLGLCGESGSGKSVSTKALMQLLSKNAIVDPASQILFRKRDGSVIDINSLNPGSRETRELRGGEIGMIFQEPMASFSPVYSIGNQMSEAIRLHLRSDGNEITTGIEGRKLSKAEARKVAVEMLDRVGIANASLRFDQYPHELSGGMRQRAMIALALSTSPSLLIADEPTTALDVTIQAQILDLLQELQDELGMSVVFITHDMGVIAQVSDIVAVMYLGRIVEQGTMEDVVFDSHHPYSKGLIEAIPSLDKLDERLKSVPGDIPGPFDRPAGCSFSNRCEQRIAGLCRKIAPDYAMLNDHHVVRCHLYNEGSGA